ncbi:predicted protein [Naegleria gruberi]|uniref:Predicted protein n=1 Tax=Naegleria gruberi TaxID=5762 RepID=D2V339_NAEGR|nr:uncharacterized protein NAEGRDRAFT_30675 [Naegleria gruberi]EFC48565.1 predicted protein [Naegleria gruberi]|eukprot:XP_002681309.1 predicted protein [Naegleria gruberi strain NEG-M]
MTLFTSSNNQVLANNNNIKLAGSPKHVYQVGEPEFWFHQRIDHFNALNTDTFPQRYYKFVPEGVSASSPNHLLYICPEATCGGTPNNYVKNYAMELKATIYTLEHRFYGKSVPYKSMKTVNMANYLKTEMALADLSVFIEYIATLPSDNNTPHQFIIVGCSYPGALSAFFSMKYPHLVKGALSSSGVVNSILDFYTFDMHVQQAAGPECTALLTRATSIMEKMNPTNLLRDFQAPADMDIRDLFLLFGDIAGESVQYGYHYELCNAMKSGNTNLDEVIYQNFHNYSLNFFYKVFETSPLDYYNGAIGNDNYDPSQGANGGRSWWLQTCSELSYFNTAPPKNLPSIRSRWLDLDYFYDKCKKIFGYPIKPNTDFVNNQYGAKQLLNTTTGRTVFVNGSQDPWLRAGVDIDPKKFSFLIECNNCGHCVDLRGCPSWAQNQEINYKCVENGNEQVAKIRQQTLAIMKVWFHM